MLNFKLFRMVDIYVAFFVNEGVDSGVVSEVYIPTMRVVYGEIETRVLELLGLSSSTTVVMSFQDSSSLRFSLLIDLSGFADKQGHLKVCRLDDCNDSEWWLLSEAYLHGRLCPYFKEEVANAVVKWMGKRRIVSFSCCDMIMDVVLSDGAVVHYSSDVSWDSFCKENHIDRQSKESLEEVVEDYFECFLNVSCREPTLPSMCWTEKETKRLLNSVNVSGYYPYQQVELNWRDGYRETVGANASKLQAFGSLVSSLLDLNRQYNLNVNVAF